MLTLGGLHTVSVTIFYLFSRYSGTAGNEGNPFSNWPAAGHSGYKLTYSQKCGVKYTTIDVIPCRCCSFTLETLANLISYQQHVNYSSYSAQNTRNSGSVTNKEWLMKHKEVSAVYLKGHMNK
jgi:hypothetical protein